MTFTLTASGTFKRIGNRVKVDCRWVVL